MTTTPDQPTRSRSRTIRWIAAGVAALLVLILVVLLVAARLAATGRASAYEDRFERWSEGDRAVIVSTAATLPEGLYDSRTTAEVFQRQQDACLEVGSITTDVDSAAETMPVVTAGFLGAFSGGLRDAARASERRADQLTRARRASEKLVEQVQSDCRWNIDFASDTRYEKAGELSDRAEDLLLDQGFKRTSCSGSSCTTLSCSRDGGCLPDGRDDQRTYGRLKLEADRLYAAIDAEFYAEDRCKPTSYRPLCTALREGSASYYRAVMNYDQTVREGGSDGAVERAIDRQSDAFDDLVSSVATVLKRERPDLAKADKRLLDNAETADRYLQQAARILAADAKKAVDPLRDWGGSTRAGSGDTSTSVARWWAGRPGLLV